MDNAEYLILYLAIPVLLSAAHIFYSSEAAAHPEKLKSSSFAFFYSTINFLLSLIFGAISFYALLILYLILFPPDES